MVQAVTAVLTGCGVWFALHRFYICKMKEKTQFREYLTELKTRDSIFLCLTALLGMWVCFLLAEYYSQPFVNCLKQEITFAWLLVIAMIDGKRQIIPRELTYAGMAAWALLTALAVLVGKAALLNVLLFSAGGLLLGGGVLLVCRLLSHGGVGMGDIRLFSVLGLLYGMNNTFSILFFTILLMSVFGIVSVLRKKSGMKSTLAMGPFIWAACCICFVLGI